jgi:hypothetical protein
LSSVTLIQEATRSGRGRKDGLIPLLIYAGVALISFAIYAPFRSYFIGDTWDVLLAYLLDWKSIFSPQNEHFIPLFKLVYLLEYRAFGAHHIWYMGVSFALHAANAVLVYLIGRRIRLGPAAATIAAAIFAISSVYFEIISWDFEQVFLLGTLFMLTAIYVLLKDSRPSKFWIIGALCLAAYFACGLLTLSFVLAVSLCELGRLSGDKAATRGHLGGLLAALWAPTLIYLFAFRMVMSFSAALAINNARLSPRSLKPIADAAFFGWTYGFLLPALTFPMPQRPGIAVMVLLAATIFAARSYYGLLREERFAFWLFLTFTFTPFLVISLGRAQLGFGGAASSRYTYLPMASFALLVVLSWQGFRRTLAVEVFRRWSGAFGVLLLAVYIFYHVKHVGKYNPTAEYGERTQRFLQRLMPAVYPAVQTPGEVILGPELEAPDYMYAPRHWPIWRALQVLEGNTSTVVPIRNWLERQDSRIPGNLLQNPGFERGLDNWKNSDAESRTTDKAAVTGKFGVEAVLPTTDSSVTQQVANTCPARLNNSVYTFAVRTKTSVRDAVVAHIVLRDSATAQVAAFDSAPHPGDDQWHQLVVSGLTTPSACSLAIEVANTSSGRVTAWLDDAIVVRHPGTIDQAGVVRFQSADAVVQR